MLRPNRGQDLGWPFTLGESSIAANFLWKITCGACGRYFESGHSGVTIDPQSLENMEIRAKLSGFKLELLTEAPKLDVQMLTKRSTRKKGL